MSDFLQSLVLRAAGLPPAAAPAPRPDLAPEPIEAAGLEGVAEETPVQRATPEPTAERAPQPQEQRIVEVHHDAPRTLFGQRTADASPDASNERTIESESAQEDVAPPIAAPPRRDLAPPEPPIVRREREHEVIRERQPIVELVDQPSIAQPPLPRVAVPRQEILEPASDASSEPTAAVPDPVILQPIVVEQTRHVVDPIREQRTIVETHTEHTIEPGEPLAQRKEQSETQEREARPLVQPPTPQQLATRNTQPETTEPRRRTELAPSPEPPGQPPPSTRQRAAEPPPVLVQPQPPAPTPEIAQEQAAPELDIRIGTIEIRAAAPPPTPPPPPPAPVYISREPDSPAGFDDYARVRSYAFPDVW